MNDKNLTSATNVSMHPLWKAPWEGILEYTVEKSQTNATDVTILPNKPFEETFKNAQY